MGFILRMERLFPIMRRILFLFFQRGVMTKIGVGILGFGTVGAGVAKGLLDNHEELLERTGIDIELRKIADLDITTDRGVSVPASVLTTDAMGVIHDPNVQIVVELIGGTTIAKTFVCEALKAGKPVVTANKKLLAEFGSEIFALARENETDIYFGASVGGGIPIIRSLRDGLVATKIEKLYGILNGTCNYILTAMEQEGAPFDVVLAKAQKLGFAEANPTLDVDGFDTLHKAAILAALAFGFSPDIHTLPVRGIRGTLEAQDITRALELGYRIKLLATMKRVNDGVELSVGPTLVPANGMMGSVSGVFNAAMVKSDMDDWTMFYGRGAGRLPTAATVVGDIAEVARSLAAGTHRAVTMPVASKPLAIKPAGDVFSRNYVRLSLRDEPGSLSTVTGIFSAHGVSILSAVQRGDSVDGFASVVFLTHEVRQSDLQAALTEIEAQACSAGTAVCLRIEHPGE